MARVTRAEVFSWDEIAIVHTMSQVVRQSYLLGTDRETGAYNAHRRQWIETELKRLAAGLGIDLLCYSLMSSHFHLVLRSRPDVVAQWQVFDAKVLQRRRWLAGSIAGRRPMALTLASPPKQNAMRRLIWTELNAGTQGRNDAGTQ